MRTPGVCSCGFNDYWDGGMICPGSNDENTTAPAKSATLDPHRQTEFADVSSTWLRGFIFVDEALSLCYNWRYQITCSFRTC